jgi:TolB-like protein/DNA-binding winged helix-turn-helix (wHTH) protein
MSASAPKYAFGPFVMDVGESLLRRDSQPVPLTSKAFELLAVLLEESGHLVEKQELLRRVWGDAFVEEAVLSVNIAAIRRALSDNGHHYIETIPKHGYRFVAPVQRLEPGAMSAADPAAEAVTSSPTVTSGRKRLRWAVVVAAAVILAALSVQVGRRALAPPVGNSVAVLPLRSLSNDPEQQHFADAMTDLMLTNLGRIPQLRVVSRQSILQYEQTKKTIPEIARELHVDCIVEGTVRREGERVRITAQLIHGPSDRHLWAQSYERDLGDTLALQAEVAEAIAREVGVKLVPGLPGRLAPRVAPAVYEAYLRGLYSLDEGNEDQAVAEFRKAVAADPSYGPAYTKMASAYFGRAFFGGMPPNEAFPDMKEAALRAIELNDSDAEAHASLAIEKLHYEWDWPGAEREFRRALQLNPSDSETRHLYAHYLLTVGRWQESMSEMDRAFENDPVGLEAAT